jgi:hypothetical protein
LIASVLVGVGQPDPPEPLSDMRGAEARSANIDSPDGVIRCFQVSAYKVEPAETVATGNLLSSHDWRAALRDEAIEVGPEVAIVGNASALSGRTEGLAGARPCPDRSVVSPARETERKPPAADAGEEVALGEASDVIRGHIDN